MTTQPDTRRKRPVLGRKSYLIRVKPGAFAALRERIKPKRVGEWIEAMVEGMEDRG